VCIEVYGRTYERAAPLRVLCNGVEPDGMCGTLRSVCCSCILLNEFRTRESVVLETTSARQLRVLFPRMIFSYLSKLCTFYHWTAFIGVSRVLTKY